MDSQFQAQQLEGWGARGDILRELMAYDEPLYTLSRAVTPVQVPMGDEPFVEIWGEWAEAARRHGAIQVLGKQLPQLQFPIEQGISRTRAYQSATLRGRPVDIEGTGLDLECPEAVDLGLYSSLAGRIPVLTVRHRATFVALVQAIAKRNEPVPVPDAQGAAMVSGLPNWQRVRRLRLAWEATPPEGRERPTWGQEMAHIRQHKELYLDRLIVLSDGPYSAIPAADVGLDDAEWRRRSAIIRREHESVHYFTRRVFDAMRNHLLDELIADYCGLVAAFGHFSADLFSRGMGLGDDPGEGRSARSAIYRGDLSDPAFDILRRIVQRAAQHVERFDQHRWPSGERSLEDRARMICALATSNLAELASPAADECLAEGLANAPMVACAET